MAEFKDKFKIKKFWCDMHQYNPFHETKDCNFNKLSQSAKLHKAIKDNVVVQKAIKSAFASYDRQNFTNVSVQDNGLSRRFQFLKYAESQLPRIPQELLDLPIPMVEISDKSDVCKCHHNLTCKLHFYGEEFLYVDADKISKSNQSQEMNPLQVLFGFIDDFPMSKDDLFIPKDIDSLKILFDFIEKNYFDFESVDL